MLGGLLVVSSTLTAVLLHDPAFAAGSTFTYQGYEQTYTVPAGVTSVTITAIGAAGGSGTNYVLGTAAGAGGDAASVTATVPVTPGQVLYVEVGGVGGTPFHPPTTTGGACAVTPPAFNGGGTDGEGNCGGGGGGASDVRTCSMTMCPNVTPDTRLVVAGGGGGGGGGSPSSSGGNGGNAGDGTVTGAGAGGAGCSGPSCGGVVGENGGFGHPPGSSPCAGGAGAPGQGGSGSCGSAANGLSGAGGGGYDGGGEGGNGNATGAGGGGGAGSSYWIPGAVNTSMTDPVGAAMVNIAPGPAAGGSQVHAVIQVETSPSFAGDAVNISSLQLENACGGVITFETLQGGSTTAPRDSLDSITVNLDDDGNVTVVVDGFDCAPGNDLIEADLTGAPYLTATTVLDVEPPQVTPVGISATPANEVETGNDATSGNSDVYTVFYVETDPAYAGQPVIISSPELEDRCSGGWRWEPASGTTIDQTSGPTAATGLLDNDGNAVFVFKGASCAPGTSTVIADIDAGSHATYSTTYTIDAPTVTAATRMAALKVRHHHRHHHRGGKGGTGSAPGSGLPAMTVTASPNPLVETGGPTPSAPVLNVVKSDNYGGSSNPPTSVDVSDNDGTITYTITLSNSGSSALDGVVVSDSLSPNPALADDTFTATETGGASGFTASATGAGFNDINDTVDLPGDSSITYTVVADFNDDVCNFGISNTATLTPPVGVTLGANSNTSATDSDTGFIGAC